MKNNTRNYAFPILLFCLLALFGVLAVSAQNAPKDDLQILSDEELLKTLGL
jgi:hypothetical protein